MPNGMTLNNRIRVAPWIASEGHFPDKEGQHQQSNNGEYPLSSILLLSNDDIENFKKYTDKNIKDKDRVAKAVKDEMYIRLCLAPHTRVENIKEKLLAQSLRD